MEKRPEWVHCVEHPHSKKKGFSICGRPCSQEWHFMSINHWFNSVQHGDRFQMCPDCAEEIKSVLSTGVYDPGDR